MANLPGGDSDNTLSDTQAENLLADAVESMQEEDTHTPKTYDEKYVQSLRDESASRRVANRELNERVEEMSKQLKAYEDAKLSEKELLEQKVTELSSTYSALQEQARNREIDYQVALAASKGEAGISDVGLIVKLLDRDSLEFDDSNQLVNLQDSLETLKTQHPSLFQASQPNPTPATRASNPARTPAKPKVSRADLSAMKGDPHKIVELLQSGELNHILRGE